MSGFPNEIACVAIYVDSTGTRVRASIVVTDIRRTVPKYLVSQEWWLRDFDDMEQIYDEMDQSIGDLKKQYPSMNIIHVEDVPLSKDSKGYYHSSTITRSDYLKLLRDNVFVD